MQAHRETHLSLLGSEEEPPGQDGGRDSSDRCRQLKKFDFKKALFSLFVWWVGVLFPPRESGVLRVGHKCLQLLPSGCPLDLLNPENGLVQPV